MVKLVQFLSKGEKEEGDISQLMRYLHHQRCLIILDAWEEINGNCSEDIINYSLFLEKVAKETHKSCLLLLSRTKPPNIEILEGQLVRAKKLVALSYEDAKEILKAEGISGTDSQIEYLSHYYSNPWILKTIAQNIHTVFEGDISPLMDISLFVSDAVTEFLDKQFQKLAKKEINLIYWIAIRRNTASWGQLLQDSSQFFSADELLETLKNLIARYSLVAKNTDYNPLLYILEPVILKYTTKRFVQESFQEIIQVVKSKSIHGSELFITHSWITKHPLDEELNQEQLKRIIKPMQKMLLVELRSQQQIEDEFRKVLSLLQNQGLSQGYASQNILQLISVGK